MWVKARLESETESGICENINIGKLHASLDSWEKYPNAPKMDKNSKINVQNRSILCENWLKRCSLNIFQRAFLNDLAQKWSIMVENCPLSRIHFCKMGLFLP